ncbi:reductase [Myxozyma melibiosi]|uniref:Reductase n=1 Tax=Myxozyma melibiosi TaxID=54550 RepID=A0ABR1FDW4_9ASCO
MEIVSQSTTLPRSPPSSDPSSPTLRPKLTTLGIDFTRAFADLALAEDPDPLPAPARSFANENDSECCGGGCCQTGSSPAVSTPGTPGGPPSALASVVFPDGNRAFDSLALPLLKISRSARLLGVTPLPEKTVSIVSDEITPSSSATHTSSNLSPPSYLKPHPPYDVHSVPIITARPLTALDAIKRTYHFDLDVSSYPDEIAGVDFRVGGAVGVCPRNDQTLVDEILERLGVPAERRDAPVKLCTTGGRWPTIWGEDEPRTLTTTLRDILSWTVDVNNGVLSKNLIRVLAEYASDYSERMILSWLCSKQGQSTFCNLRSAPYPPTLLQLLLAFPSSLPPVDHLVCVLPTLMPRFYSLSSDPVDNFVSPDIDSSSSAAPIRRIEIAVTVHEAPEDWRAEPRMRAGNCTAFLESLAHAKMRGEKGISIPVFRGLQANPLAKEFRADGPMLLIGAGVGVAPFRGFVQRRLKSANCKNKVWVLQGCRDSLVDELYAGEWGVDGDDVRKVVESRRGTKKYVQDEVVMQADLVWSVISHPDGRIFVCGSSKGMGEGVEAALVNVAMEKGGMTKDEAAAFWKEKSRTWQYVTETW